MGDGYRYDDEYEEHFPRKEGHRLLTMIAFLLVVIAMAWCVGYFLLGV